MSASSREIERQVEASRANIDHTIEAIRDRMSIGQIVDEALHYFGDSATSRMTSRLGAQVRDNPLPLALVGIGLAWLMSGRGQPHLSSFRQSAYARGEGSEFGMGSHRRDWTPGRRADGGSGDHPPASALFGQSAEQRDRGNGGGSWEDGGDGERETFSDRLSSSAESTAEVLGDARDRVSEAASSAADAARSTVGGMASAASACADRLGDAAGSAWQTGRDTYRSGRQFGARAYNGAWDYGAGVYGGARSAFLDVLDREPLILGAVGVAVGAAIGAMLPRTSLEDEYLGEARDQLLEDATEAAREQLDRAQTVAENTWEAARDEMEAQGLTPDELGERARNVLDRTEEAIVEAVKAE